jgi:hypothetical protein
MDIIYKAKADPLVLASPNTVYAAITEHDNTGTWSKENIDEVQRHIADLIPKETGILECCQLEISQGIELSVNDNGTEIHMLGLYMDHPDNGFKEYQNDMKNFREERIKKICSKAGMDYEKVKQRVGVGMASRMHVAHVKWCELKAENENIVIQYPCARTLMNDLFSSSSDAYVGFDEPWILKPEGTMKTVYKFLGIPGLSHRWRYKRPEEIVERYLALADPNPFFIEAKDVKDLDELLEKGLIPSIGNDFHGFPYDPEEKPLFLQIPNELGEEMIKRQKEAVEIVRSL